MIKTITITIDDEDGIDWYKVIKDGVTVYTGSVTSYAMDAVKKAMD